MDWPGTTENVRDPTAGALTSTVTSAGSSVAAGCSTTPPAADRRTEAVADALPTTILAKGAPPRPPVGRMVTTAPAAVALVLRDRAVASVAEEDGPGAISIAKSPVAALSTCRKMRPTVVPPPGRGGSLPRTPPSAFTAGVAGLTTWPRIELKSRRKDAACPVALARPSVAEVLCTAALPQARLAAASPEKGAGKAGSFSPQVRGSDLESPGPADTEASPLGEGARTPTPFASSQPFSVALVELDPSARV